LKKTLVNISFLNNCIKSLRKLTIALAVVIQFSFIGIGDSKHQTLEIQKKVNTKVPEPSDVAIDPNSGTYYIVSDNGILFETNSQGKILRKSKDLGFDFEGVEVQGDNIFVSDESARKVMVYSKSDFTLIKSYRVSYAGGRNEGFESITYNKTNNKFILISEKDPVTLFEYDENFHLIDEFSIKGVRDISSARWYNNKIYLLSDEDRVVLECDPNTYRIEKKLNINILNPEGIAFNAQGNIIITSDDLQKIYTLKNDF
jgi:uncharacterized protein YjiK